MNSIQCIGQRLWMVVAVAALAAGCGDDGDEGGSGSGGGSTGAPFTGSCDVNAELGFCYDYVSGWTESSASRDCELAGAFDVESALGTDPCPTAGAIGTCDAIVGGNDLNYVFYADSYTNEQAEMACPGTYSPL